MSNDESKPDRPACALRITANDGAHHEILVSEFPCRIGRRADCDIAIDEPSVSGLHLVLALVSRNRIQAEDQWSTNGMYLDGNRVTQVLVDRAMTLIVGKVRIELRPEGGAFRAGSGAADRAATGGECFYRHRGHEYGPYMRDQLERMAHEGTLQRTDLVWLPDSTEWLRGDLIAGLFTRKHPVAEAQEESPSANATMIDDEAAEASGAARPGKRNIVCPHCWHRFGVEEFLFIARHQSLVGDPVLGADAAQRFLPSRFTPEGNAVDSAGTSCPDMACPRCHLRIPQSASEMPPLFLSIVGATASGKSYFLTSLTWELRNTLAKDFAISFTDTDAINNQILNEFEETIFLHSDPDELVALRKTELQGELYNQVLLDSMIINLPKPFMFSVNPAEHHANYLEVREKMSRTLVLYDNAGEHFEPGMDSVDNPTTQHLLHSDMIFFLYDPTKDVRFRKRLGQCDDPQLAKGTRVQRQEIILTEMINRIKKYSGMRAGAKTAKTLVIIVSKCDLWLDLLADDLRRQPWQWASKLNTCALDIEQIKSTSFAVRSLLADICPEMVATAESFAGDIVYMPNSALGRSPELNVETGMLGIRPQDIEPFWASVPMLYFFYERGFIPALPPSRHTHEDTVPVECQISGDVVFVTLPGDDKPLEVPLSYLGSTLRCPRTGRRFELPMPRRVRRKTTGNS